jgi:hypothetical protein
MRRMKILSEPIDAIVKFTKGKEHPVPYKFRYADKEQRNHEVRIDKIITVTESKLGGIRSIIYLCQSKIDGVAMLYELKYLISDCRWELYKM